MFYFRFRSVLTSKAHVTDPCHYNYYFMSPFYIKEMFKNYVNHIILYQWYHILYTHNTPWNSPTVYYLTTSTSDRQSSYAFNRKIKGYHLVNMSCLRPHKNQMPYEYSIGQYALFYDWWLKSVPFCHISMRSKVYWG